MIVAGIYSFNGGREVIEKNYASELAEVLEVIRHVDSGSHKTKSSDEKTMMGRLLYSPSSLNGAFKGEFSERGWISRRVKCDYPTNFYTPSISRLQPSRGRFAKLISSRIGWELRFSSESMLLWSTTCAPR